MVDNQLESELEQVLKGSRELLIVETYHQIQYIKARLLSSDVEAGDEPIRSLS